MKKIITGGSIFVVFLLFPMVLFAATEGTDEVGFCGKILGGLMVSIVFLAIGIPFSIYALNKWRLWIMGFRIGGADSDDFISAVKWTIGAGFFLLMGLMGPCAGFMEDEGKAGTSSGGQSHYESLELEDKGVT